MIQDENQQHKSYIAKVLHSELGHAHIQQHDGLTLKSLQQAPVPAPLQAPLLCFWESIQQVH